MRVSLRIVAVTLATAGALAPLPLAPRWRSSSAWSQEIITATGTLNGWRLSVDGTVYLRIQADYAIEEDDERDEIPPGGMWFYTPPDRSDDLQLEQMALHILLASEMHASPPVITVTAKKERALDGEEMEEALPLESIGRL